MRVKTISLELGSLLGIEECPNFHKSGNIEAMKEKYYGREALLVRCGDYIYNVTMYPEIYERAE